MTLASCTAALSFVPQIAVAQTAPVTEQSAQTQAATGSSSVNALRADRFNVMDRTSSALFRPDWEFSVRPDGFTAYIASYRDALRYGRCAANVSPDFARDFVSSAPGQNWSSLRRLTGLSKGCLPAGTHAPIGLLRASLSENFYRASVEAGRLLPAARSVTAARTDDADPNALAARCYVYGAPKNVDALLRSAPGTKEERQAIESAGAAAPFCKTLSSRITNVAATLRPYIAVEAYRVLSDYRS